MWYKSTTNVVIADNIKSRDPARTIFAQNRRRMDGWVLISTGRTKNEGLNEGLGCVSCGNLQLVRCQFLFELITQKEVTPFRIGQFGSDLGPVSLPKSSLEFS